MVEISDLNPFGNFDVGLGTVGNVLILMVLAIVIVGMVGFLVWFRIDRKRYKIIIPLYSLIGNKPTRLGTFRAKEVPMGKAGDKLWFVKGVKKYIPPATIQSAPNEFWHWIREDGEWVNFSMESLDTKIQKAGVQYIQQDMRLQRLATDRLLEQRLLQKGFWEKWGLVIGYVIFFLVITVSMIIIFYQFSSVVEKMGALIERVDQIIQRESKQGSSLLPAFAFLLLWIKEKVRIRSINRRKKNEFRK